MIQEERADRRPWSIAAQALPSPKWLSASCASTTCALGSNMFPSCLPPHFILCFDHLPAGALSIRLAVSCVHSPADARTQELSLYDTAVHLLFGLMTQRPGIVLGSQQLLNQLASPRLTLYPGLVLHSSSDSARDFLPSVELAPSGLVEAEGPIRFDDIFGSDKQEPIDVSWVDRLLQECADAKFGDPVTIQPVQSQRRCAITTLITHSDSRQALLHVLLLTYVDTCVVPPAASRTTDSLVTAGSTSSKDSLTTVTPSSLQTKPSTCSRPYQRKPTCLCVAGES